MFGMTASPIKSKGTNAQQSICYVTDSPPPLGIWYFELLSDVEFPFSSLSIFQPGENSESTLWENIHELENLTIMLLMHVLEIVWFALENSLVYTPRNCCFYIITGRMEYDGNSILKLRGRGATTYKNYLKEEYASNFC